MDTINAIIASIRQDPGDLVPRFALADFLEEHGIAYAANARRPGWGPIVYPLVERWLGCQIRGVPISDSIDVRVEFGLIAGVQLRFDDFLGLAGALARHPVSSVRLTDLRPAADVRRGGAERTWITDPFACHQAAVPSVLLPILGGVDAGLGWVRYPTEEAAWEALSDACLRYLATRQVEPWTLADFVE